MSVAPDRLNGMIWYFCAVSAGNQLDDGGVDLELRQVDGRDAVLLAEEGGELLVLHEPELGQIEAELPPVGLLIVQGFLELVGSDALLF